MTQQLIAVGISIAMALCGVTAVFLMGTTGKYRKWGAVIGLLGQPCWLYAWNGMPQDSPVAWSVLILTIFYTLSYLNAINNLIIKPYLGPYREWRAWQNWREVKAAGGNGNVLTEMELSLEEFRRDNRGGFNFIKTTFVLRKDELKSFDTNLVNEGDVIIIN